MSVMTPPTDLLGSCAPSLVHAERDSRFIMDGDVTVAGHLCFITLLPNAQGKIIKAGQFRGVSLTPHSLICRKVMKASQGHLYINS